MEEDKLKAVLLEIVRQMASPGGIGGLPKDWLEAMETIINVCNNPNCECHA